MAQHAVCFTGMELDERDALHVMFHSANDTLGNRFALTAEAAADVLVIDLDSIYGQMTWLKARHGKQHIVALSSGSRAEAGLSLTRPVSAEAIAAVLREVPTGNQGATARAPAPAPAPVATPTPTPTAALETDAQPPAAEFAPPPPPRLGEHLEPGALTAPVRIARAGAEPLVLDPTTRVYFGPSSLKALLPYCHGEIPADELEVLNPAQFAQVVRSGGAQPMARLRWLFALVSGEGRMLPGYGLDERYSLSKWPQIEREFPKHFRIATAMMKGPATLDEIAALSSSPLNEVIDFVNASLVSGFAQVDRPPPTDVEPAARGGLFDRLRGKKG